MVSKHRIHTIVICGVFLLALDQAAKLFAMMYPDAAWYVWHPWIGWEFFLNTGIAFSLPFPTPLLLIITPLILGILLAWFFRLPKDVRHLSHYVGVTAIFFGALSNLIDRIALGATIDYIRILTAIINLADILIVIGVVALLTHIQNDAPRLP